MLFSAISRNAAGTSIFGMSNFGSSKEGISNEEGMDLADFAFVVVAASAMGFIQKGRFPNTLRTLRPLKLVRCSGFAVVRRSDLYRWGVRCLRSRGYHIVEINMADDAMQQKLLQRTMHKCRTHRVRRNHQ